MTPQQEIIILSAVAGVLVLSILLVIFVPHAVEVANSKNDDDSGSGTDPTDQKIDILPPSSVSLMTYNIFNANIPCAQGTKLLWSYRKDRVLRVINDAQPHVFFLNEAILTSPDNTSEKPTVTFIHDGLHGNYDMVPGLDRSVNDPNPFLDGHGECVPMYWNTNFVECLQSWQEIYKDKASGEYPRTYTYGKFRNLRSNQIFWAFGTHMARKNQPSTQTHNADELINVIKSTVPAGEPYFILADWNNGEGSIVANEYIATALGLSQPENAMTHYHSNDCTFESPINATRALDRIIMSVPLSNQVSPIKVFTGEYNAGAPASDHNAVYGVFNL